MKWKEFAELVPQDSYPRFQIMWGTTHLFLSTMKSLLLPSSLLWGEIIL